MNTQLNTVLLKPQLNRSVMNTIEQSVAEKSDTQSVVNPSPTLARIGESLAEYMRCSKLRGQVQSRQEYPKCVHRQWLSCCCEMKTSVAHNEYIKMQRRIANH